MVPTRECCVGTAESHTGSRKATPHLIAMWVLSELYSILHVPAEPSAHACAMSFHHHRRPSETPQLGLQAGAGVPCLKRTCPPRHECEYKLGTQAAVLDTAPSPASPMQRKHGYEPADRNPPVTISTPNTYIRNNSTMAHGR